MGAINYIAYVIFAVLFLSIVIAMLVQYKQGAAEQDFRLKAEELSDRIKTLGSQDPGTVYSPFDISIPANCELHFVENENIVGIMIGSWSENFPVGIPVSGPSFSNRGLSLRLERMDNEVTVSEA
jgi:uncharacterized membrane protein